MLDRRKLGHQPGYRRRRGAQQTSRGDPDFRIFYGLIRLSVKELHTCAWKAAWIWAVLVLAPMGVSAQCEDVLVATGLVFSQGEPAEGYGLELEVVSEHADGDFVGPDDVSAVHANGA